MPKDAGWKTSMVLRVSMVSMFSWVSTISGGCSAAAAVLCVGGGHEGQSYFYGVSARLDLRRGLVTRKRPVNENDSREKSVNGC